MGLKGLNSIPKRGAHVEASADGALQRLAGDEADDATLGDLDGGTGPGVAGRTGAALRGLERAETDEGDGVASLQCPRNAVEQRVDCRRGVGLGGAEIAGNLFDEVVL